MKKQIAILLCLVLCLSLAGCFGNSVVGSWTGTVQMADIMNQTMADTETPDLFHFENISLEVTMTFQKDGTCTMTVDEDSFRQAMQSVIRQMLPGLKSMLEETYETDIYILLENSGMTEESFLESMAMGMLDTVDPSAMEISSNYIEKDGMLYLSGSDSLPVTEISPGYPYSIKNNVLTIEAGEDNATLEHLLPLVLHKNG